MKPDTNSSVLAKADEIGIISMQDRQRHRCKPDTNSSEMRSLRPLIHNVKVMTPNTDDRIE